MTKTTKIVYGSLLVVIAILLAVGGVFDLTIANNVYQPENLVARILECVGYLPPFLFVGGMFAVLFFRVKAEDEKRKIKQVVFAGCTALTYVVFGYMMAGEILSVLWQKVLVGVGSTILLAPLTLLFFRGRKDEDLKRFEIFLIFASIVCVISSLLTINVVKFLWGRARYREMMADGDLLSEAFTPWYHPNGFTLHGHHSFPSGHTSAATNLMTLFALEEVFLIDKGRKKAIYIVVGMWIFIMAYSRLVLGAHFLSDVTGGFAVGFVTYAVARYVYFDKSRAVVTAIMEVNAMTDEEDARAANAETTGETIKDPETVESDRAEIAQTEIPAPESEEQETEGKVGSAAETRTETEEAPKGEV